MKMHCYLQILSIQGSAKLIPSLHKYLIMLLMMKLRCVIIIRIFQLILNNASED